jgi:hypothetical protein
MVHLEEPLPSRQHRYPGLPELSEAELHRRREGLFLIFAGLFLGTLAMLNILGITRFIKLFEVTEQGSTMVVAGVPLVFAVAVGVLPYPLTFLCTDFISELYGRRRASAVVWVGLMLNIWVVAVLWLGGWLPGFEVMDPVTGRPVLDEAGRQPVFFELRTLAFGAVAASMVAYLVAQLVDVHVFHFWKRLTRGRHLWLRNNASTLVSQIVDTSAVILITHFFAKALPIDSGLPIWPQLGLYIATGYTFKALVALVDTVPFIVGTRYLARYLRLEPTEYASTGD